MSERRDQIAAARELGQVGFEADTMAALLAADAGRWQFCRADMNSMRQAIGLLARALRDLPGDRLADRSNRKTPLPRVPCLLQGAGHPSVIGVNTIRGRLRQLSTAAKHAAPTARR
jgi:hypothetical protein